jgi:hypothetical protein
MAATMAGVLAGVHRGNIRVYLKCGRSDGRFIGCLFTFSFSKLAQRFGNAHPTETPSPLRLATTSNAIPMLTRVPPKRSFASPIRSQSASLTLGTRVESQLGG